jgi:hypothetical protein
MSTKIKVVLQIIAPLIIGMLVYMLFRLQPPFGIFLPWNKPLIDISFLPNPLYLLVVHVAPNALWTFAFVGALNMQMGNLAVSAIVVMSVVAVFEYCQHAKIISGTGDFIDVVVSLFTVAIYTTFSLLSERRAKNEKNFRALSSVTIVLLFVVLAVASSSSDRVKETSTSETGSVNTQETSDAVNEAATDTTGDSGNEASSQSSDDAAYETTYSNARTYKNSIGTVWVQSIFVVTNTGATPLYLSSGAYDLEDESGTLVKSRSLVSVCPNVINPGEKAYYYEETTIDISDAIDVTILPRADVKVAKVDCIRYPITDVSLSEGSFGSGIKVLGRIENNTDTDESLVNIAIILFDSNDVPIGVIHTFLTEYLDAGAKIGFEASSFSFPDDITVDSVARYEVYGYPTQMQF